MVLRASLAKVTWNLKVFDFILWIEPWHRDDPRKHVADAHMVGKFQINSFDYLN